VAMGLWMDQVARGWLIYELTDSPFQLGLVRGVQAIPVLILSPVAGSMADRYSRKMQSLIALVLDGLMYAALAVLILTGRIEPWHVYVTAFGTAIVQTFHQPARIAMVADSVPKQHLTNAIGLNSIAFNVSRSTAPALAGLLIAKFGTGGAYTVQAALYLLGSWVTLLLRFGGGPPPCRISRCHKKRALWPEHHRRMEVQLEKREGARWSACGDVGVAVHHPLHDASPRFCPRHP